MQKQNVVCSIDGENYEFYMMPPSEALKIFLQLAKRALGPIGGAVDIPGLSVADLMQSKINLNGFLSRLAENLEEDWAQQTIMHLLKYVRHGNGTAIQFDVEFQGCLLRLFKIIGKSLEVNYKDFWEGLRGFIASDPGVEQATK